MHKGLEFQEVTTHCNGLWTLHRQLAKRDKENEFKEFIGWDCSNDNLLSY